MNPTVVIVLVTLLATGFAWVELLVRAGRVRRLSAAHETTRRELEDARLRLAVAEQVGLELRQQLAAQARQAELQMEKLRERLDQLELRDPETGTYVQAIRLVRRGAGVQALVDDCGLTRAEAELLIALHGREAAQE